MTNFFTNIFIHCDAPRPWGVYFQDSASPQMEALIELHDNIMFYLVIILFGVAWIIVSVIRNYVNNKSPMSNKYLNHGTLIEFIWTITPALILILIAFPSFKLLYLMDEVTDPSLTVFVEGHQWYWSYQFTDDFFNNDDEELEFDSYLVPESDLIDGVSLMNSGASTNYPDAATEIKILNCPHNDIGYLEDISPESKSKALCDHNIGPNGLHEGPRHSAFAPPHRQAYVCRNCFALFCSNCMEKAV